jgi:hypothetical protein
MSINLLFMILIDGFDQLENDAASAGIVFSAVLGRPVHRRDKPLHCDRTYDELQVHGQYLFTERKDDLSRMVVPVLSLFQIVTWCKNLRTTHGVSKALLHFACVLSEISQIRAKFDWLDFERLHCGAQRLHGNM